VKNPYDRPEERAIVARLVDALLEAEAALEPLPGSPELAAFIKRGINALGQYSVIIEAKRVEHDLAHRERTEAV
jgi:hypothetical protein